MKLLRFPVIQFTVYLIIGILIAHNFSISCQLSLAVTSIAILVCGIVYFLKGKSNVFNCLVAIVFLIFGITTYTINNEKNWANHYTSLDLNLNEPNHIVFKLSKRLKPNQFNNKYHIDILQIEGQPTRGKLLLNIEKDTNFVSYVGNIYSSYTTLNDIRPATNPHQFDYKAYLEKQYIYKQLFLSSNELIPVKSKDISIYRYADRFRKRIYHNLSTTSLKPNELAIINALLLGQRQDISKDIYDNYVNAGVIHILAVSGLHVGIIMLILQFLFRPLTFLKHGNYLRMITIVILLWAFAIVAGMSPSVTRAVAMFTVVVIALNLKRKSNIYNTLAISAFAILLVKPIFLFHVGFQLSYLAVIAIVSFQPLLYKLIPRPKYWVLNKLWEIFTVTLAAQIGVLPLSLYYFHQFPGLFFISNLVIIPFLGLILGFGLLVIVMAFFNVIPEVLASGFGWTISALNTFIDWIATQENFLFKGIPFGILQVIASYILIISLYRLFKNFRFKNLAYALVSVLLLQITFLFYNTDSMKDRFIVFNKNRHSLIGIQNKSNLHLLHNLAGDISKDYAIVNYTIGNRIRQTLSGSIPSVIEFNSNRILILDSLGIYNVKSFKPDYVVLRNSPRVNLKRLIDSIQPKQIIADASNYKSYVQRWKATCTERKIPFHSTYEKGAFILD